MEKIQPIKLPSNAVITPDSIWKVLQAIAKTGDVFTKKQLIVNGGLTWSEDNVSRILSYIKYLGIIDETRERQVKTDGADNSKNESGQKFKLQKEDLKVRNLIYELKANRIDAARAHLKKLLTEHVAFAQVREGFFGYDDSKTFVDLEHFLKDADNAENNPQYYLAGGKFLMSLFEFVGLVKVVGNDIKLLEEKTEESVIEPEATHDTVAQGPTPSTSNFGGGFRQEEVMPVEPKTITINYPGVKTSIKLETVTQIALVETILAYIKNDMAQNPPYAILPNEN